MTSHDEEPVECCGVQSDWLIAEATDGRRIWRLWRCPRCEAVYLTGWIPPSWGNKLAQVCAHLHKLLDAAVAEAYRRGPDMEP